jgi:wobble nucleotide-excising tRNase
MFRLTEKAEENTIDESGKCTTDKLITRGRNEAFFKFKITDGDGNIKENIRISLEKGTLPGIPNTNYIFHTFNQDYVENNIKTLNFEKNSDVDGFILGRLNIDLNEEENKLAQKKEDDKNLTIQIADEVNQYVETEIKPIRDINRIKEYKLLHVKDLYSRFQTDQFEVEKSMESLLADYNKIKSVPETLARLNELEPIHIDSNFILSILDDCRKEFVLSDIAAEFKEKVRSKQKFIEIGLDLIDDNLCPFCEQDFQANALSLIDQYNEYLQDKEAVTLKRFETYQNRIEEIRKYIKQKNKEIEKRVLEYDNYKSKYIPSLSEKALVNVDTSNILVELNELEDLIEEQRKDISKSVSVEKDFEAVIAHGVVLVNQKITRNNELLKEMNNKLDRISEESLAVRREICKAAFNHLTIKHKTSFENIANLRKEIIELEDDIKDKKLQQRVSKKDKMVETIKNVLGYFFANKYSLDPNTFRLTFNNDVLEKDEANHVLSDGEKTIVAFAYFIGDVHLKVSSEDDYKKLFFIIDDPISSMDFDHVYTLCGVLRDLKEILPKLGRERMFVFTHNSEFMRVLTHHRIISKRLILKKGKLLEYSVNSTVPYISHLLDIYKISKKIESPSHTTANSIRHIVETLTKFDRVILEGESIKNFIADKLRA